MSTPAPENLYHIVSAQAWSDAVAAGEYRLLSLASEGFIHLSTLEQVDTTLRRHFAAQSGLLLLTIDTARLTAAVRWEEAPGGYGSYPHLYGLLNLDAVIAVSPIASLPEDQSPCHRP